MIIFQLQCNTVPSKLTLNLCKIVLCHVAIPQLCKCRSNEQTNTMSLIEFIIIRGVTEANFLITFLRTSKCRKLLTGEQSDTLITIFLTYLCCFTSPRHCPNTLSNICSLTLSAHLAIKSSINNDTPISYIDTSANEPSEAACIVVTQQFLLPDFYIQFYPPYCMHSVVSLILVSSQSCSQFFQSYQKRFSD